MAWDKNCGIYNDFSNRKHLSFWGAIVQTPEWSAWEKEIARRMSNHNKKKSKTYTGCWDVAACRECGWLSVEHAKDFLKFVGKSKIETKI